jgi:hypothetical protein
MESILQNFFFFGVKLGHFNINIFFLYVTKMQAYQQKTKKFFVSKEKKFGRIDSWLKIRKNVIFGKSSPSTLCHLAGLPFGLFKGQICQ